MRRTWRATEPPSSFLSMRPDCTSASPNRRLRSAFMRAETSRNCSSVMRPRATRASPRRSFFRLLAAKTSRPRSKKRVFATFPDRTCRSPLLSSAEIFWIVSAMGVTLRSVSMATPLVTTPPGGGQPLLTKLSPEARHLPKDTRDHGRRGEVRDPADAGEVVDAHLDDRGVRPPRPEQELGVDEAALALELDPLEERAPEELEREVDVTEAQPEEGPHERAIGQGVDGAQEPLRGAVEPVGGEDVRVLVLEEVDGAPHLPEVEGKVGVAVEHELLRGERVAAAERASERAVALVARHPHPRVRARERFRPLGRPVRGRVVHDHDLEVRAELLEGVARRGDRALHVLLLVVHGKHDADGGRGQGPKGYHRVCTTSREPSSKTSETAWCPATRRRSGPRSIQIGRASCG